MTKTQLRYLASLVVEPATEPGPTIRLEDLESGSGCLVGDLSVLAPEGQNRFGVGDVLFSKLRPYLAKSMLVTSAAQGSGEFLCMRPRTGTIARFLLYATLSRPWLDHAAMTSYGTKMPRTSWEQMSTLRLHLPGPLEQQRIADFLDDRVVRIDQIIAARGEQLKLLNERVASAVERLLTPQEGSGRWIRVKEVSSKVGSGKTPRGGADAYVLNGIPFLRSQNVHDDGLRLADVVYISEETDSEMAGTRVHVGDVLLNITGASLGRCCVATSNVSPANVSQHVCIIRPDGIRSEVLALLLRSKPVRDQVGLAQVGGNREGLNFEQVRELRFWYPYDAMVWQRSQSLERDAVRGATSLRRSISLFQEYKQSLITAAVTGQIDVTTAGSGIPG